MPPKILLESDFYPFGKYALHDHFWTTFFIVLRIALLPNRSHIGCSWPSFFPPIPLGENHHLYSMTDSFHVSFFHAKNVRKKQQKNTVPVYKWVQKSMQKTCKKQAKIMHFLLPERQNAVQFQHGPRI